MIAACPKCSARYRIERERLQPSGARLRCSRCEVVFRVRPPKSAEDAPSAVPEPQQPAAPQVRGPRVLVALDDAAVAKEAEAALRRWGFEVGVVSDGVEALLATQRHAPRVLIAAADLPRMSGLEILESLRRNEAMRELRVVLVGALDPVQAELHLEGLPGPDGSLELADVPDGLAALFESFELPLFRPPRTEGRRAPAASGADSEPAEVAPAPAPALPADDGLGAQRADAERLARIIVSDIVLYNADKFAAALRADDIAVVLEAELAEGRRLFSDRVDARIRNERDYLADELRRVARARATG